MVRQAGQLISRARRTWIVRVSIGREPETGAEISQKDGRQVMLEFVGEL